MSCATSSARLREHDAPFTFNTDGPEMLLTNLVREYQFVLSAGLLSEEEARVCMETARSRELPQRRAGDTSGVVLGHLALSV